MNRLQRAITAAAGLTGLLAVTPALALPKIGTQAPPFVLPTAAGSRSSLRALNADRPVLLNFFASW